MKTFFFLGLFLLSMNLAAKDNNYNSGFSEEDKQRLTVLIRNNHYLKPKVNQQVLSNVLDLNSFLNKLDPYSKYFSSKEMHFKQMRSKVTRLGVGLDLLIEGDSVLGIPVKGGPAYKAGFTSPMYINTINNRQIDPLSFDSYEFLANFSLEQKVEIQTISKDLIDMNKYQVKVASFDQKHVSIQHLNQFNVLTIRHFSDRSTTEIKKSVNLLSSKKPLIIDLRHNPGGDLYATVDTLSFFLENDLSVAFLQEGKTSIPLHTISDNYPPKRKIYLLLSPFTASSAEIFAQAIKHYIPKTILVGSPTLGKCLAQEIHSLANESAIQLSAYQVLNAKKEFCQNIPLSIDIELEDAETIELTQIISLLQASD